MHQKIKMFFKLQYLQKKYKKHRKTAKKNNKQQICTKNTQK